MKCLALLLFLALGVSLAYAQNPVITQPKNITTSNASSTIAVTNTFQSIWAASASTTGRVGCTVVNYGSNTMWVYFGDISGATKAKSIQLAVGQAVYCTNQGGTIVARDQVSITGTAAEAFVAILQ